MDTKSFKKWLGDLGSAWIARDPDAAADLCSENVVYYEDPFQPPLKGKSAVREVWLDVPKSQKDIQFKAEVLGVTENIGVARWWASFTRLPSGDRAELDGIFVVRLSNKGLCTEFRQWWNNKTT